MFKKLKPFNYGSDITEKKKQSIYKGQPYNCKSERKAFKKATVRPPTKVNHDYLRSIGVLP